MKDKSLCIFMTIIFLCMAIIISILMTKIKSLTSKHEIDLMKMRKTAPYTLDTKINWTAVPPTIN